MWKAIPGRVYRTINQYVAERPVTSITVGRVDKAIKAAKLMMKYEESKSTVQVHFVVDERDQINLIEVEETQEEKERRENFVNAGLNRISELGNEPTKTAAEIAEDARAVIEKNKALVLEASVLLMFNVSRKEFSGDYAHKMTDRSYVASQYSGSKRDISSVHEIAKICNPKSMMHHGAINYQQMNSYSRMGLPEILPALEEVKADVKSGVVFKVTHAKECQSPSGSGSENQDK